MQARSAAAHKAFEEARNFKGVGENNTMHLANVASLDKAGIERNIGFVQAAMDHGIANGRIVHATFGDKTTDSLTTYMSWLKGAYATAPDGPSSAA